MHRVLRVNLDQATPELLGLIEEFAYALVGLLRSAQAIVQAGDVAQSRQVFRLHLQHLLEFANGGLGKQYVLLGGGAGDKLRGESGGQVHPRGQQFRIVFDGLLEVLDRGFELAPLVGAHTLVQFVASLELVAPGGRQQQENHYNGQTSGRTHPSPR